jgi:hypothetical protein
MQPDTNQTGNGRNGRNDSSSTGRGTSQRYTVHDAALLLGLSIDAVRKRAERGSLRKEKARDGTVYILLDTDETATGRATGQESTTDETATSRLVDSLQNQIEYLRQELEVRNEELRRKDHLLAAALERIPAIEEASPRPLDGHETPSEEQGRDEVPPEPEERSSRPSLLRRFFGLE